MLQKAMHEAEDRQSHGFPLLCFAVFIAKSNVSVFQFEQISVTDRHPVDIRGEIFEHVIAVSGRFAVDNPAFLPDLLRHFVKQIGLFEGIAELGSED